MKSKLLIPVLLLAGLSVFYSCEKDDAEPRDYGCAQGVFISCEGAFNANNGSISWYDPGSSEIVNNLFYSVNGRPAGDVVQSFAQAGSYDEHRLTFVQVLVKLK